MFSPFLFFCENGNISPVPALFLFWGENGNFSPVPILFFFYFLGNWKFVRSSRSLSIFFFWGVGEDMFPPFLFLYFILGGKMEIFPSFLFSFSFYFCPVLSLLSIFCPICLREIILGNNGIRPIHIYKGSL